VAEWYAGSKLLVYIDPEDEKRFFGKEHGLLLMNHTYETDWLTAWMITNFDRNFEKDKIVIKSQLTEVFSHPDPVWLLLNAEGTRFTAAKHELSVKFAQERGLPVFKHQGIHHQSSNHAGHLSCHLRHQPGLQEEC